MKMLSLLMIACGVLVACGGDDGGDAPACTGALYDLCTDNTDCMSNNCRMFNDLGVMLCTEACTPGGTACPTQDGAAVNCPMNAMVCRPPAANSCTL